MCVAFDTGRWICARCTLMRVTSTPSPQGMLKGRAVLSALLPVRALREGEGGGGSWGVWDVN